MLDRLVPHSVDNTYYGYWLAPWFFAVVVFMKLGIGLTSIFNGYAVASSADGIPLDAFTPAGAKAVVSLLAAWGLALSLRSKQSPQPVE